MLHCFEMQGDKLVYDAETQALVCCDEYAWALLKAVSELVNCNNPPQLSDDERKLIAAMNHLDYAELEKCWADLKPFIESGHIGAKTAEIKPEQLYPAAPRIKSMCLNISHDCNLRCQYCFASCGDYATGHREMLSYETGKKAVDFLIKASGPRRNLDIDFFGGEPLMNWKVLKALTLYCEEEAPKHNKKIRLTVTTNALLLNDERTKFINEHMKNCVLSIDGRPEIQDKLRPAVGGHGSYSHVMPKIKKFVLDRGNKEYYVRGTFTHYNTDFSEDVKHLATLDLRQISMEPVVAKPTDDFRLRDSDIPKVLEEYEKLAVHYQQTKDGEHPYRFFHFNVQLEGGACAFKRYKGCGVGTEYIAVTPNGSIYPCHQFVGEEQYIMGNVNDTQPDELDKKVQAKFKDLFTLNSHDCLNCWSRYHCGGGCPANNWHQNSDLHKNYKIGCIMEQKRLECSLWLKAKERGGLQAQIQPDIDEVAICGSGCGGGCDTESSAGPHC
ncbi:thioether cross-link-forming SCIFF peptide maturase [Amygdalobacter nucleatus]|nr:thioether cross-link-forming SCIFF peptide maturase [Amygdalobacter nucleatus]MDF0485627.1 thioether cross-link-forming SCIFF peptide maturase [Amygdalobacter nucleatus]WEG36520.1 thioether cross-link-forming SCIFF peptide maturase [Amygdalobacter nucleatus]